jgi:hypothetical protein
MFVAHVPDAADRTVSIGGVEVQIRCVSFSELFSLSQIPSHRALRKPFKEHVIDHLNSTRTPQKVRNAYLSL